MPMDVKCLCINVHFKDIKEDMVEAGQGQQGKQVRMMEGVTVSYQKDELHVTTVKNLINNVLVYCAQEGMFAGADGLRQRLQQLQHQ